MNKNSARRPKSESHTSPDSKSGEASSQSHRTRTGALRREQTRRRLLSAALAVFAEKGTSNVVIEDFIAAAGVARGTFYNYFSTTEELLDAVTSELTDQVLKQIDDEVLKIGNPLERLTNGCLMYMHAAVEVPHLGAFLSRTGSRSKALGRLVDVYLPRDLEAARQDGSLHFSSLRAARDLVIASLNRAIDSVHGGHAEREHLRDVFELVLRGLGVTAARAGKLSHVKLPTVDWTLPTS